VPNWGSRAAATVARVGRSGLQRVPTVIGGELSLTLNKMESSIGFQSLDKKSSVSGERRAKSNVSNRTGSRSKVASKPSVKSADSSRGAGNERRRGAMPGAEVSTDVIRTELLSGAIAVSGGDIPEATSVVARLMTSARKNRKVMKALRGARFRRAKPAAVPAAVADDSVSEGEWLAAVRRFKPGPEPNSVDLSHLLADRHDKAHACDLVDQRALAARLMAIAHDQADEKVVLATSSVGPLDGSPAPSAPAPEERLPPVAPVAVVVPAVETAPVGPAKTFASVATGEAATKGVSVGVGDGALKLKEWGCKIPLDFDYWAYEGARLDLSSEKAGRLPVCWWGVEGIECAAFLAAANFGVNDWFGARPTPHFLSVRTAPLRLARAVYRGDNPGGFFEMCDVNELLWIAQTDVFSSTVTGYRRVHVERYKDWPVAVSILIKDATVPPVTLSGAEFSREAKIAKFSRPIWTRLIGRNPDAAVCAAVQHRLGLAIMLAPQHQATFLADNAAAITQHAILHLLDHAWTMYGFMRDMREARVKMVAKTPKADKLGVWGTFKLKADGMFDGLGLHDAVIRCPSVPTKIDNPRMEGVVYQPIARHRCLVR